MERLSTDPGIRSIMENHQWGVGLLKEFAPSLETGLVGVTEGCLLGYNRNKGEEIALRLRTGLWLESWFWLSMAPRQNLGLIFTSTP